MKPTRKRTAQTEPIDHHAVSSIFYFAKNIAMCKIYARGWKGIRRTAQHVLRYLLIITTFTRAIKGQEPCILRTQDGDNKSGWTDTDIRVATSPRYGGKKSLPNPVAFSRVGCW